MRLKSNQSQSSFGHANQEQEVTRIEAFDGVDPVDNMNGLSRSNTTWEARGDGFNE